MRRRRLHPLSIALSGLLLAACTRPIASPTEPALTSPLAVTPPAVSHTPTGITIESVAAIATATSTLEATAATDQVIVQGRVYDASQGVQLRLSNATLDWQFFAPEWQQYNGHLDVPEDGLYRLLLPIRPNDEVIITARAWLLAQHGAHLRQST